MSRSMGLSLDTIISNSDSQLFLVFMCIGYFGRTSITVRV
ncbi:MAG: hypothetical protein METHAR1v1_820007 [Methanothrix sp.]|nr:MAG: hypothetical protein METHAR1v1_820007 [Methanothrix sp.]